MQAWDNKDMENLSTRIRTRFAPSPTGFIHLGN